MRHPVGTRPCQDRGMDEYFIGAGALLTSGPSATIAGATLHAQPAPGLAGSLKAALVDFEAVQLGQLSRILIVAAGWSGARFQAEVVRRLVATRECGLGEVIATLAEATGTSEVHVFAHWVPDEATNAFLAERGVQVLSHPLAAIGQAALVSGQRLERWRSPVRAA
ncbi:MAG: hypothetical protein WAK84_04900 [Candidatus Cybelea sp.]